MLRHLASHNPVAFSIPATTIEVEVVEAKEEAAEDITTTIVEVDTNKPLIISMITIIREGMIRISNIVIIIGITITITVINRRIIKRTIRRIIVITITSKRIISKRIIRKIYRREVVITITTTTIANNSRHRCKLSQKHFQTDLKMTLSTEHSTL
jgi:hypothetical protein